VILWAFIEGHSSVDGVATNGLINASQLALLGLLSSPSPASQL